jgi:hypothetical protein
MQYTIESRQLTRRPTLQSDPQITIEAATPDEAVSEFVRRSQCELVSLARPIKGGESIATIKKDDAVFLLRVYSD